MTKVKECKVCGKEMILTGGSKLKNIVCGEDCFSKLEEGQNLIDQYKENMDTL